MAWAAKSRFRPCALSALRLAMAISAGCCAAIGRMAPRVAPPAPQISTRLPASDTPRLRWMSFTRPRPSKFCAKMRPPSNLSAFTAPARRADSIGSVAISKACSLKGMVTFMPRPPAAMKASTVVLKPSSGPSMAVY
ncbi:hypothetical protein D9M69_665130 [compost metagenome]